jgi:hypothetical protein
MKKILFLFGGVCAATVGFVVLGTRRTQPVETMTREPEPVWTDQPADRHTAA